MNIDKAIDLKEKHRRLHPNAYSPELLEADNLSIEALIRIRGERGTEFHAHWLQQPDLLPGETST